MTRAETPPNLGCKYGVRIPISAGNKVETENSILMPSRIGRQFGEDRVIGEFIAFGIKNAAQVKAAGRGGDAGQGAFFDGLQLPCPVDRLLARAYCDQAAGDVADHVVQKRIGGDVHDDFIAFAVDVDEMHLPKGALGLATLRAKRGKIVMAD